MRSGDEARRERPEPGKDREKLSAKEHGRRFKESLARVKKNHAAAIKRLADR